MDNDAVYPAVAARLRKARLAQKLPLDELAARSGITTSFLGQIERGERKPSLLTFVRVARGLGVPIASLFADGTDGVDGSLEQKVAAWERRLRSVMDGCSEERRALVLDTLTFVFRRLRRVAPHVDGRRSARHDGHVDGHADGRADGRRDGRRY
jgi:transcriptional regulator with XRE-family HTH domain